MARNYKKENKWESSPEQIRRRVARNRARREMERRGLVHKGDGKEVDHIRFTRNAHGNLNNSRSNLRVVSRHTNRKKQPRHKGR